MARKRDDGPDDDHPLLEKRDLHEAVDAIKANTAAHTQTNVLLGKLVSFEKRYTDSLERTEGVARLLVAMQERTEAAQQPTALLAALELLAGKLDTIGAELVAIRTNTDGLRAQIEALPQSANGSIEHVSESRDPRERG